MIASLRGILLESSPLRAVVECSGVGYEVHIPVSTAERLPAHGREVFLHTVAVYAEDSASLFGFATTQEREMFRLLREQVSGIGAKTALGILSHLSPESLRAAILAADARLLAQCPGIGKKTAERMIIELRDRVGAGFAAAPSAPTPASGMAPAAAATGTDSRLLDAISALVALGYKAPDADKSVHKALAALGPDCTTEQLVKSALRGS